MMSEEVDWGWRPCYADCQDQENIVMGFDAMEVRTLVTFLLILKLGTCLVV